MMKPTDIYINQKHKARNFLTMGSLLYRLGPIALPLNLYHYPWLRVLLKANDLHGKTCLNREGVYLEASAKTITFVVKCVADLVSNTFGNKDRVIIHEDMIPPEIVRAMGLVPYMAEFVGLALPLLVPSSVEEYIDACESHGVPPDICSLPKSTIGLTLSGHMPPARAIITSNLPCDAGMTSYTIMEKRLNLPIMRVDIPHHFYSERAQDYFSGELRRMIAWIEAHTPGKMDWDKLRQICEERNKMVEYELELWDMLSARPAPLAGEPIYLSHLLASNVVPGEKHATRIYKDLVALCRKNVASGRGALKNEKFRALLWNPPLFHVGELFNWAETAYGVSLIMDSMSYNRREPFIDTSTEASMLRGLGQNIMEGPMARHTRGPAENYIEDIFRIVKQFDIDMLWVAGHVGCKNTAALNGMLRERCREEGLPMLIINYDLSDPRIVSKDGILEQINHFMENIMQTKRQDI